MSEGLLGLQILSGGVLIFITIVAIVWWALCIILFFKVWGMTNDTREIRDMLEEWLDIEHPIVSEREAKTENTEHTSNKKDIK